MKKRALISVSDKTNIEVLAKGLIDNDYEIVSTGGTLKAIQNAGIKARAVEEITGFPEILDGRVKTLHPFIHASLLAKRENNRHQEQLQEISVTPIDLVAVNLYPFKATLEKAGVTEDEIVENIDIGGPTMLRSAAKNYPDVTVVVDPDDYEAVLAAIQTNTLDEAKRKELAAKVFRHTANYDAMIANYFTEEPYPEVLTKTYEKVQTLRYGENPHQTAAFYQDVRHTAGTLAGAKQLHGKELSYNNIQDANAALEIIADFDEPAAVAVKHMNPCGIGIGDTAETAFAGAYDADPVSIFGGIVAVNREIDVKIAKKLSNIFLEIVIAPDFSDDAFAMLTKKKNIRLLELDKTNGNTGKQKITSVMGGMLIQDYDTGKVTEADLEFTTKRKPTAQELENLLFAWKAVKHVKSNAIVLANDKQTIGVGAGQMNRIGAANIAIEQAGEKTKGAVMASDAFFPMPDTVEAAAKAGITAIIQPGGSKRDQDSIDVCNEYGIAMVFTGMRHFKH
ncbi:bifunctional phosphoribosylaminoimidazolecarboxamide formyltransferase/IMP cyclohydrolase [Virgibacillus dakarensis]|uniref:bifunctional phosphoribosylaminoimidazolecarboxamide formyltransferase/IMP cyclohydrolase n=1 Tax=Virgibacillus dakarensis TaxID=1917889 RepID=UPI000B44B2D1|nr:bifunctional phosphoribosylaminoimidazolecarboxamide formyltransferase/IMP cyclohydrolase [Virgibacillus dakarensis]MBT2217451.1 bifunctional phosphoribosylaminoimidazolecarboxamide formyltransferase/IMP cyclohydrolase [Virgibacillus dakarensis]MTW86285.1 bifunctional phosphoribosylaminoimidazolecarboxamide formyltransferase/IMP cyclohydrolase [Virgibacillus dakarensis]